MKNHKTFQAIIFKKSFNYHFRQVDSNEVEMKVADIEPSYFKKVAGILRENLILRLNQIAFKELLDMLVAR